MMTMQSKTGFWSIALAVVVLFAVLWVSGCAGRREPSSVRAIEHHQETTPRSTTADGYISREAADMAIEDQERSAQSQGVRPKPAHRDNPMHNPARSPRR